jgi:cytochrome c oxidase subunit 2
MKMLVTVLSQADYDAWVRDYGPPPAITERAKLGQATFSANCALCHTITGGDDEEAQRSRLQVFLTQKGFTPVPAPNLTDLRTRQSLGAGLLDLNVDNLRRWLHNPERIKPGNCMAERALIYRDGDISLDDNQIGALIEYLLQLQ